MKKFLLFVLFISGFTVSGFAQLVDDFSDGDFTNNPTWVGTTENWTIAQNSSSGPNSTGGSQTLRLNASATGLSYLMTQRTASWGNEQTWAIWIGRRTGSPATYNNRIRIWLYASQADISQNTNGYRISFGSDRTQGDSFDFEKVTNNNVTTLFTSATSVTNGIEDFGFQLRVTRSSAGVWTLYTSDLPTANGGGVNAKEPITLASTSNNIGTYTDNTYTDFANGYYGVSAYHTAGNDARTGLEFDNFMFDTSASSTLPVSLTSFTAKANQQNIDLAWNTASEKDNSHFDILRSGDGKTFSKIGEVKGAGNSSTAKNYAFTDKDALPGVNYYQLKQVDNNGSSTTSKVEAVKSNVAASNFKVATNKQEGTVKLTVYAANAGKAAFKIYDLNGRKLTEQELTLDKGYTNLAVPFNGANGLHVASLTTATEIVTQKFIK
ncbi:T9SS type A sorting domain-containing protein [Pedobacter sp. UBA4863]|uniref:T9SS type A sorting domain-containing protein n=1 Tax=Pedobacter sp. UBA4863 TaxID=1947060 RepID=UPI0025E98BE6|nr:T9SS type A sorting domain-containing protein [Pedobacter sp. UBA4863]